ncbi:DUF6294 family protein [Amycolatopsis sp. VS8301801F10]|uniref:DUF6294 family protein n=1 Tax=Amycolatopsis sp. VS8301801F10 TaxID=2652442 RepID=UPI0038FD0E84
MNSTVRRITAIFGAGAAGAALLAGSPALAGPARPHGPLEEKSVVWGQLHAGDCQQDNGTIVVRSDGTGEWSATTLTYQTHSGDVWHSSFDFYTTAGYHLFRQPNGGTFDSPRMNDGNPPPRYSWGAKFTFNPADYSGIDLYQTQQHYSC